MASSDLGTIHAKLDVDVRQAKKDIRSLTREARRALVELRKLRKYEGKHSIGSVHINVTESQRKR